MKFYYNLIELFGLLGTSCIPDELIVLFLFAGSTMEGPEITFLFQFGNLRDTVTVAVSTLNLRSFKDLACDFINSKVHVFFNT